MKFTETSLPGVILIEPELIHDERGFFARTFCLKEFAQHGLSPTLNQCNISFNKKKGTLRGMHYQIGEHAEAKLVRCTMGCAYDVIVDLRPPSPSFKQWIAVELSAQNRKMIYIPEGCAHGFQTLEDNTELFYQMSAPFHAQSARGVRWNDRAFGIQWPPIMDRIISIKDQQFIDFAQ